MDGFGLGRMKGVVSWATHIMCPYIVHSLYDARLTAIVCMYVDNSQPIHSYLQDIHRIFTGYFLY